VFEPAAAVSTGAQPSLEGLKPVDDAHQEDPRGNVSPSSETALRSVPGPQEQAIRPSMFMDGDGRPISLEGGVGRPVVGHTREPGSNQRHLALADPSRSADQFAAVRIARDEHRAILAPFHRALIAVEVQTRRGAWT
jgi:hypothetical protein